MHLHENMYKSLHKDKRITFLYLYIYTCYTNIHICYLFYIFIDLRICKVIKLSNNHVLVK